MILDNFGFLYQFGGKYFCLQHHKYKKTKTSL